MMEIPPHVVPAGPVVHHHDGAVGLKASAAKVLYVALTVSFLPSVTDSGTHLDSIQILEVSLI